MCTSEVRRCARCGNLGHFAKKCEMPKLARPDVRRIARPDVKSVGAEKVMQLVAYIERLERERANTIPLLRRYMEDCSGICKASGQLQMFDANHLEES